MLNGPTGALSSKAFQYYKKWSVTRFRKVQGYVVCILVVLSGSVFIHWVISLNIGGSFDFILTIKMFVIFASGACFFLAVVRLASVGASWVIAQQAEELLRFDRYEEAVRLLNARFNDIHPIVVNHPAFQELLVRSGCFLGHAGSAQIGHLMEDVIATKSKLAKRLALTCIALLLAAALIRIIWAVKK
jgi:hypothetical protein